MRFMIALFVFSLSLLQAGEVRTAKNADGKWELTVDGKPFVIKGATTEAYDEFAIRSGVNTVRTYWNFSGTDRFAKFEKSGIKVICGLVIQKDGKLFDYSNPKHLEKQRRHVLDQVRAVKQSPALLLWGLGNETEGVRSKGVNQAYWNELEFLVKLIKTEDPAHPVMNTVAGNSPWKLEALKTYVPSLDIVGINAYKEAGVSARHMANVKYDKPFILTEFGPAGHWQVPKTAWGAPIEPKPDEKALTYATAIRDVMTDTKNCLGTVCFVWGQKQEVTGTWFGMFLESGEKTVTVDAVAKVYSGKYPKNRAPSILRITSALDCKEVPSGTVFRATAETFDPEGDALKFEWKVIRESGVRWAEGDREPVPPTIGGCFPDGNSSSEIAVKTPSKPGAYRLFLFIRDGQGGGAAHNIPFLVNNTKN